MLTAADGMTQDLALQQHEYWMERALEQAEKAAQLGEVPVGAILVRDGQLLGAGFNCPISGHDPTAHAEIRALRAAAANQQNYRLPNTTLYVTIEPCTMCLGAMIHARVSHLVYGASEPKAGVIHSADQLAEKSYFNHTLQVTSGVLADQCSELMSRFFQQRRADKKAVTDAS